MAKMERVNGECTKDHGHMTYAMTCEIFGHMVSKAGHGLEMVQGGYRDAEEGHGEVRGDLVHNFDQHGHIYAPCRQGVWVNGRKKIIFKFWKNKNMGVMPNSHGVSQYF